GRLRQATLVVLRRRPRPREEGAPACAPDRRAVEHRQVVRHRAPLLPRRARLPRRGVPHPVGEHDPDAADRRLAVRQQAALRPARPAHHVQPPRLRRAAARRRGGVRVAVPGRRGRARRGPHADARQAARRRARRHRVHARGAAARERHRAAPGLRRRQPVGGAERAAEQPGRPRPAVRVAARVRAAPVALRRRARLAHPRQLGPARDPRAPLLHARRRALLLQGRALLGARAARERPRPPALHLLLVRHRGRRPVPARLHRGALGPHRAGHPL
ncbi:MAG: Signal peptidase I, partial [uncultured Gemmatimonadaceae bacterium]